MFWNIPIPGVYSWCFGASENPLGAEYIFLEKQAGFIMIDVWHSTKWKQKVHILDILDQVVDIGKRLPAKKFCKLGALCSKDNLPDMSDSDSLL